MSLPILTVSQMREWESHAWGTGITPEEVIARVGREIAAHARRMTQQGDAVLILAGKGNNGADGHAAVDHLYDRQVMVLEIVNPPGQMTALSAALAKKPALVIDALFGIGLNRTLSEEWCDLLTLINDSGLPVLSVDVPSGLDADTGEPGGAAVKATATLTVGAPKKGLVEPDGVGFTGRLLVTGEVGLGQCKAKTLLQWTLSSDFADFPPRREMSGHKGTYGHLLIIAGSKGYHGAATLCAKGAQRARPGLVTVLTMPDVYPIIASQQQAVMVNVLSPETLASGKWTAIAMGPGLAAENLPEEVRSLACQLWDQSPLPVLVDASALRWLKPHKKAAPGPRVITPHPGEAAGLLDSSAAVVQADRPKALRELSTKFGGCHVVLKGHHTLVGARDATSYVNSSGNPSMAQGGSGDLLAGYLGGLLAQPKLAESIEKTLRYGVWQHGASADLLDARANWVIEDLAEVLGQAQV